MLVGLARLGAEFPEVTDVPEEGIGSWFGGDSYYSGDRDYRADVRCKREGGRSYLWFMVNG